MLVKVKAATIHAPKGIFPPGTVVDLADGAELCARGFAEPVAASVTEEAVHSEPPKKGKRG